MPLLKRRRPSCLAVAFTLALFTLGLHRHRCGDDDDHEIMVMSFFAHAAMPNNDDQPTSPSSSTATTITRPPNYYELLGLESPDTHRRSRKKRSTFRAKIGTSDIKKAYRKQAQMYHPDKARNKNITTQDATSRFAEIAEAYQILIDPQQRYQYDWELLELEDDYERDRLIVEQQQQQQQNSQQRDQTVKHKRGHQRNNDDFYERVRHGASNFNAWKSNLDPWAVFEEFFFQDDESIVDNDYGYQESSKSYTSYYHDERSRSSSQQYYNTPTSNDRSPQPHVHETTIYQGYDPDFGADRYTVFRREEYIDGNYFRIVGQDFISGRQVDPFTGFALQQQYYSAVTEPYFVDEGYLTTTTTSFEADDKNEDYNVRHNHDRQQTQQHKATNRNSQSRLDIGESFTPNDSHSNPWISSNEDYRAILTDTCELQIISKVGRNKVIWSSETYIPNTRAHGCHLTLNSIGRLVLSVDYGSGLESIGNTVLWETPLPRVVPHWSHDNVDDKKEKLPVTFQYYASLDDDGVIAIYRVVEKVKDGTPNTNHTSPSGRIYKQMRPMIDKLSIMYHRVSNAALNHGQTKASIVWDELRYKVGRMFTSKPIKDLHSGVKKSHHECVYSTSLLGCLVPGRNAIVLSRKIVRSINSSLQLLDAFLKSLAEPSDDYDNYYNNYESSYPYYEDDEEDNILDTLLRVTGTVGAKLGKVGVYGMHAAHHKLKQGGKIAGRMVGRMKKRVGTESVRWGQKLHERADADSFF